MVKDARYGAMDNKATEKPKFRWGRLGIGVGGISLMFGGLAYYQNMDEVNQTAKDMYFVATNQSGDISDIKFSNDPEIVARGDVRGLPSLKSWPMTSFMTSENFSLPFIDRGLNTACSVDSALTGELSEYRQAVVQSIWWASVTKPSSLDEFQLQLTPEETADFLLAKFYSESRAGAELEPDGTQDTDGQPEFTGPFHFGRVTFVQLMKRHGPPDVARHIEYTYDDEGEISGARIIDADDLGRDNLFRNYILNLRNDPYIATYMTLANMYEATDNLQTRLEASGLTDVAIGKYVLFMHVVLGDDLTAEIVRAHYRPDGRTTEEVFAPEIIASNPSLFYDDEDNLLPAEEIFPSFQRRHDEKMEAVQTLLNQCDGGMSQNRRDGLRQVMFSHPAFPDTPLAEGAQAQNPQP